MHLCLTHQFFRPNLARIYLYILEMICSLPGSRANLFVFDLMLISQGFSVESKMKVVRTSSKDLSLCTRNCLLSDIVFTMDSNI